MGAFVKESPLDTVQVPCPCEGKPHEYDELQIVRWFTGGQLSRIQSAMFAVDKETGAVSGDVGASNVVAMQIAVRGWTFVDEAGVPIPFDAELIEYMRGDIWRLVMEEVDKRSEMAKDPKDTKPSAKVTEPTSPVTPPIGLSDPDFLSPSSSTSSPALAGRASTTS